MDQGVASLLGALVGGAATYGGVLLAQRGVDRRERETRDRQNANEALIGARILQSELAWAEARIEQALKDENGKYWSERYGLRTDAPQQHQESIALALGSADDWADVRDGFRAIRVSELQASKRRRTEQTRAEITDWGCRQLGLSLTRIRRAIEVLKPVAKDRPRESLSQDRERPEAEASIDEAAE